MKINIKYSNLDSTLAIEEYINQKIGALEKFVEALDKKGAVKARVEIARTTKHHQKGEVYHAECNLELPGKLLRAEAENWDIRLAIDEIRDILALEIKQYSEKFRPQDGRGQEKLRNLRGK
ncbi:MAG: ribosomal subunit interface protein [Candidatus Harrisonbacteria bacterium RIFCSPLOWO2_02_FULL_41_13b]|uniref:Ribosomal subunit interface protein n=1 Tax=Candidatus Harrisonbacteria bacterium RIFCSPLOWO2_02_FULL_41_13b TaxID=1798409 RepID=A0A1G1ZUE5_9BACT|nr:MAG: ribosomal subunit interface protein [Candidatus Harrisonbacteria bacterium RIFCSPHIGHO2_02_FULL_40_20]OGY68121.1 MAG: ribosomal subunit interface protein [Candidatus Harrisonbacteria bacterium RIFCSPLOWO2_02_FULL_41_13b]